MNRLALVAIAVASTLSIATAQNQKAAPLFIPVGIYYTAGELKNVIVFDENTASHEKYWFSAKDECMDQVRKAVEASARAGQQMIGACMPVPATYGHGTES